MMRRPLHVVESDSHDDRQQPLGTTRFFELVTGGASEETYHSSLFSLFLPTCHLLPLEHLAHALMMSKVRSET